jgi:hypothetical protein
MTGTQPGKFGRPFIPTLAAVAFAVSAGMVFADEAKPIETFMAYAVSQNVNKTSVVRIGVQRWSTDAERSGFLTILRDKGQPALMEAMLKAQPVGYIRLANSRGYELKYARSNALPDGTRQVVIALDRPLSFGEVLGSTVNTQQYNFAFVELRFPKEGKGEGKLAPATMISIDPNTGQIEIENYTTQPVRLSSITSKVEEKK